MAIMITVGLLTSHAYAVTPKETVEAFHKAITSGDKAAASELLAPEVLIFESGSVEGHAPSM